jgi:hypothetical protein
MATATLPTRMADNLLDHVGRCSWCRNRKHCPIGKSLIRKALKERHG